MKVTITIQGAKFKRFPFGKYKGKKVTHAIHYDPAYIEYVVDKHWLVLTTKQRRKLDNAIDNERLLFDEFCDWTTFGDQ